MPLIQHEGFCLNKNRELLALLSFYYYFFITTNHKMGYLSKSVSEKDVLGYDSFKIN